MKAPRSEDYDVRRGGLVNMIGRITHTVVSDLLLGMRVIFCHA